MADRREHVERLFTEALELAPEEWSAFLENACRDDPELKPLVWELLDREMRAGSFLNRPPFNAEIGAPPSGSIVSRSLRNVFDVIGGDQAGHKVAAPRWKAGELINDRFAVVRFIARGGMGEVYEVEDRSLQGVHLGLKTVLTQAAEDPLVQKRFEREILHAREVVHPNLCPIYDIFRCEHEGRAVAFLTMKLLSGETLAARIAAQGRIDLPEATAIIRQTADALGAIHHAGILHRDIKTSNIMLDGHWPEVHVCVMDFGLAHAYDAEARTLTTTGLAGTPAYMAPELFRGELPSTMTDIYALGVVAYEMLLGRLPRFGSSNMLQTREDTEYEALPAEWKSFIEGCLNPDPGRRFHTVRQAVDVLDSGHIAPPPALIPQRKPHHLSRRAMMEMGAGASLVFVGGAWFEWPAIDRWMHPIPEKRYVALMAWPSAAGDTSALVSMVLASIRNRLVRAEAYVKNLLVIVPGDLSGNVPVADPAASMTLLGANLVLAASLQAKDSAFTLLLKVLDASNGKTLRKHVIVSNKSKLSTLAERGSIEAAKLLGLPAREIQLKDADELKSLSPEALLLFSQAEEMVNQPNDTGIDAAILKYGACLEKEPRFHLGYAKLAMAYIRKYHIDGDAALLRLARQNAEKAADENSGSAKGLLSRAQVYLYTGKQEEALTYFAKALKVDPGDPETMLYKAQAFRYLNRWPEAERVYRDILKERPNYWFAHNELGVIMSREAKYQQAAEEFAAAAMAAPNVALPLANLGMMYMLMGKYEEAIDASKRSIARHPNMTALLNLGDMAFEAKDYKAARGYYEQASVLDPTSHAVWRDIGDCYAMDGNGAKVRESYSRAAKELSRVTKENPRDGPRWMTLAFYHAKIGDPKSAETDIANAEKYGAADVKSKFMKVQALVLLGKKAEALDLLLECMNKGLAPLEVEFALDLKDLRKDPRYLSLVAKTASNRPAAS